MGCEKLAARGKRGSSSLPGLRGATAGGKMRRWAEISDVFLMDRRSTILFFSLAGILAVVTKLFMFWQVDILQLIVVLATLLLLLIPVSRPDIMLLLLLGAYLALGRPFSHIQLAPGPVPLYPGEAALAILTITVIYRNLKHPELLIQNLPYKKHVTLLLLVGMISLIRGLPSGGVEAVRSYAVIYYILFLWLVPSLVRSPKQLTWAINFLLCICVLVALALVVAFDYMVNPSRDFGNPPVAYAMTTGLLLFFLFLYAVYRFPKWQWMAALLPLPLFLALRLQTRTAWMGFGSAFLVLLLGIKRREISRRAVPILLAAAVLVVVIIAGIGKAVPDVAESLQRKFSSIYRVSDMQGAEAANERWRLDYWQDILGQTKESPLLGIGFGTPFLGPRLLERGWEKMDERAQHSSSHNSYLGILLYAGIPTLLIYLALVFRIIRDHLKSIRQIKDPHLQMQGWWLLAGFVCIVTATNFSPILETPYVGILNWSIAGALAATNRWKNA